MNKTITQLVVCLTFAFATASAQSFQNPIFNTKGVQSSEINAITHDASGNIYFCGKHLDTLKFGATTLLPNAGGIFWGKASASGTILWMKQGGTSSPSSDRATEIALDKTGNVYVCGWVAGNLTATFNGNSLVAGSIGFIVKYDANGNYIWAHGYSANIHSIAIDNNNVPIVNYGDNALYKLNPADGVEDYLNTGALNGNLQNPVLHNIKVDKNNNIIAHAGNKIRKFDNNFSILWTQTINASLIENFKLSLDSAGNVYSSFYGLFGTVTIGTSSKSNFPNGYVYKLDKNTGAPLFIDSVRIGGNASKIREIIPDNNGNYYISGDGAFNTPVVLKINASKTAVWQNNLDAKSPVNDVDVIADDCLMIGGRLTGNVTLGTHALKLPNGITTGIDDAFLIGLCSGTLSIKERVANSGLVIYPNPNNGFFTIGITHIENNTYLEIMNVLGEKVYEQVITSKNTQLNTNLKSGVYFVNVIDATEKKSTQKIIIQ